MLTAPLSPKAEKDALYAALSCVVEEWETARDVQQILALCDAAERADEVLQTLEGQDALDHDTRLHVVQLNMLLHTATQTLEAIQDEPLASVNLYPVSERQEPMPETVFLAGTLIECPRCQEGLYKVVQESSTSEIVLDDGPVLVPLNRMIPARAVGSTLACPLCEARLLKDGKLHTLQEGWR